MVEDLTHKIHELFSGVEPMGRNEVVAFHEAGHTVITHENGIRVNKVTLRQTIFMDVLTFKTKKQFYEHIYQSLSRIFDESFERINDPRTQNRITLVAVYK